MSQASINGHSSGILYIHAQTSLHPGAGTALGVVDMPVQRERHTQWPTIPASSLKGILRDACREQQRSQYPGGRKEANENDADLVAAFGPATTDDDTAHAGALCVTDARILAFPVRSLRGVFAWVTCPAVLERLRRDLSLGGMSGLPDSPKLSDGQAVCRENSPLLINNKELVLEEFDFQRVASADPIADWLAKHVVTDEQTAERLRSHLVVLNDNDFTHFVRHATEVVARIGLDYERKTVKTGALFYQEFLPPETILYSVTIASDSRRRECQRKSTDILSFIEKVLESRKVLQIGADESTGKGLCFIQLRKGA